MKTRFRFVLIPVLILALLLSMISFPSKSVQAAEKLSSQSVNHLKFPKTPVKDGKVEIPEWRTANSKHYLKDDGTFVACYNQVYFRQIKY